MTKTEINIHLAAILTTVAEVGGMSPRTPIYMAMGMNIDAYTLVESLLCRAGLAVATTETLTLTDSGKAMAAKIEADIASRRK